jgi:hypothetical protein
MERRHFGLLISALIASPVLKASPVRDKQASVEEHRAWVGEVLTRMGTIRPGMTRKQLMGVFTPQQAGKTISTISWPVERTIAPGFPPPLFSIARRVLACLPCTLIKSMSRWNRPMENSRKVSVSQQR